MGFPKYAEDNFHLTEQRYIDKANGFKTQKCKSLPSSAAAVGRITVNTYTDTIEIHYPAAAVGLRYEILTRNYWKQSEKGKCWRKRYSAGDYIFAGQMIQKNINIIC